MLAIVSSPCIPLLALDAGRRPAWAVSSDMAPTNWKSHGFADMFPSDSSRLGEDLPQFPRLTHGDRNSGLLQDTTIEMMMSQIPRDAPNNHIMGTLEYNRRNGFKFFCML